MREKLIQYVELLFAGAPVHDEVKQEILQNTLDRYDDLVSDGKSPEAAYQLAIRGIGDIHEIVEEPGPSSRITLAEKHAAPKESEDRHLKLIRAVAVGLYILCPLPVLIFQNVVGVCLLLAIVAAATIILVATGRDDPEKQPEDNSPRGKLKKSISSILWSVGTCVYFILSFATGAWYITWLIFPITAAVKELVSAVMDFMEAQKYEE